MFFTLLLWTHSANPGQVMEEQAGRENGYVGRMTTTLCQQKGAFPALLISSTSSAIRKYKLKSYIKWVHIGTTLAQCYAVIKFPKYPTM